MRTHNPDRTPFDEPLSASLTTPTSSEPDESTSERSDVPPISEPDEALVADLLSAVDKDGSAPANEAAAPPSLFKRLLNWRTLVPLAIVIALLVFAAHNLQIDPAKTWDAVRSANPAFFLAGFVIYYLSFLIRAVRWKILLENVGYNAAHNIRLPGIWKLTEIIYMTWFANTIVPAKLGDVYRIYAICQEAKVSATRTVGTVVAERLCDLAVLLLLFVSSILISLHANLPSYLRTGLYVALVLVVVGVIALFLLRTYRDLIRRFVPKRLQGYYDHLHEGTLGSFRRVPLLFLLSVGVWLCEIGRFFFVALALNLIGGSLLHIAAATTFIALSEALLSTVPFTSGGVGLVEGGMLGVILLFTPSHDLAAAGVLLDRVISLFSILLIGFLIFLITSGRQVAKKAKAA